MGLSRAKILVIDDNQEHGQKIADALWKSGRHVLFVHYSEQALMDKSYGVHSGVRAIFLDINLSGDGITGSGAHLFAPAMQALKVLLDDENGPFALITWSSHDDEAEELYRHLRDRLPEGKKPVLLSRMDKNTLLQEVESDKEISKEVLNNLSKYSALRCLTEWEGHVHNASAAVVKSLTTIADDKLEPDFDKKLEGLLLRLAMAEAGKWLDRTDDIAQPLYSLLSSLLGDRLSYISGEYKVSDEPHENLNDAESSKWKSKINTFLHFDSSESDLSVPGSLFDYPLNNSDIPLPVIKSKKNMSTCIRAHFLEFGKEIGGYTDRNPISEECELMLMDITPPCDHSNKKVLWRRFIVACKIPAEHVEHLWLIDRKKNKRVEGKLKGDHLRLSPQFAHDGKEFVLVFNANLQSAIPEHQNGSDWKTTLGKRKGRIREQLLSDLMGWLGRHITRGGIVELR